ncbi:MAG: ATP-binding protein [Planctomycetota bacterium]
MSLLTEQTRQFAGLAASNLEGYLGLTTESTTQPEESPSLETSRGIIATIHYTGTVYGEYALAMDESVARKLLGDDAIDDDTPIHESEACDALMEILNVSAGAAIVDLQVAHPKLTITSPRLLMGQIRYPNFPSACVVLETSAGRIECHFCLDSMRLDLTTTYEETMASLVQVNDRLRTANETLQRQQTQLVHAERLASLGILASGVAHEINNPLFFVESNLGTLEAYIDTIEQMVGLYDQLSQSVAKSNDVDEEMLETVRTKRAEEDIDFVVSDTKQLMVETSDGVKRIRNIVQGLREFSPMEERNGEEVDLNAVLSTAISLIKSRLPREANITTNLAELPLVRCNATDLGQVFSNVLLNSVEAIEEGGTVCVRSSIDDGSVRITIEDNGPGFETADLPHVIEPFFSTRSEAGHTGLGLSIAYGIVSAHGGEMNLQNQSSGGAVVTIQIPTAHQAATAEPSEPALATCVAT